MNKGYNYLGTNDRRLPYGLASRSFTVDVLREAGRSATKLYDREHVTPGLGQHNEGVFKSDRLDRDFGNLRWSMDTFEDYLRVVKVFQDIQDRFGVGWIHVPSYGFGGKSGFKLPKRRRTVLTLPS